MISSQSGVQCMSLRGKMGEWRCSATVVIDGRQTDRQTSKRADSLRSLLARSLARARWRSMGVAACSIGNAQFSVVAAACIHGPVIDRVVQTQSKGHRGDVGQWLGRVVSSLIVILISLLMSFHAQWTLRYAHETLQTMLCTVWTHTVQTCNLRGYRYPNPTPLFGLGEPYPHFSPWKGEEFLSSAVNRGDLRRLNCNKTFFDRGCSAPGPRWENSRRSPRPQSRMRRIYPPHSPVSRLGIQGHFVLFWIKSNQIKSTVDLVRLLQLERRRITLSS